MVKLYFLVSILLFLGCEDKEPAPSPEPEVPVAVTKSWVMSPLARVTDYEKTNPSNKITLHMAKGEAEHFQVVLETPEKGTISVEQSNPQNGISLLISEIRAYEGAEDVLVAIPEGISTKTKVVKLWATYETTTHAAVGEYQDVLIFKGTAGEIEIGVTINIYDVTIPVTPSIPAVMGINPPHVSSAKGEELLAKRKEFSDELLKRRIMPFYCSWHPNSIPMAVECLSSPYPWDDPRTLDYMEDPRYTHLLLPCHLLSDEQIKQFSSLIKSRFPTKKQVFYVRDEPLILEDYRLIKEKAPVIHNANPDAQIITTFFRGPTDPDNRDFNDFLSVWDHLKGYTNIYCAGVWAFQYKEERAAQCRTKCDTDEEFWTYTAMGLRPGLTLANETTPVDNHAVMWRVYKEEASGYLYWVVNAFSSLSPLRPRSELPKGDGMLIYPGESFNSDTPGISMRLERFRDGCEEYELMNMLEKKTSRSNVLSILEDVYKGPGSHIGQITTNSTTVDNFKIKLLEELKK